MTTTTPADAKRALKPGSLRHKYVYSGTFHRVSVIQGHTTYPWRRGTWLVIGPGLLWLGQKFDDYGEAVRFAHLHASRLGEGYWSRKYATVGEYRNAGKATS